MTAKRRNPSKIDSTLTRLVRETCYSYRAVAGEELPVKIAQALVMRAWTEQWPHYIQTQLAMTLGLDQIAEMNGATQAAGAPAPADAEDDAEE